VKSSLGLLLMLVVGSEAESLSEALKQTKVEGYIRGTYQHHDVKEDRVYKDDAIGGKLHLETGELGGISVGASLYTSYALFHDDNRGLIPLRGDSHKSYSILGEAYIKATFAKNLLTVGLQEIETPFAQVDDIGMVPNSFEAVMFQSQMVQNTTLTMGHIVKMAGVDAPIVDKFSNINEDRGMQLVGIAYEGIEDLTLQAWYYNLDKAELDSIIFLESDYEKSIDNIAYGFGLQYAKEGYSVGADANVYGVTASLMAQNIGLTVRGAYTEVKDNGANSGFGGGAFYSNSEYLILDNAGANGKATWYGVEYEASNSLEGLTVGLGRVTLENSDKAKATEVDLVLSYEMSDAFEVHAIASNLKGTNVGEDDAKHLRIFANYNF